MATIASNVIQFTPRATEPEAIFNEYIEGAKTLPIIAKSQIVWNDQKWNLKGLAKPERPTIKPTVRFPDLSPKFLEFIKAYVAWNVYNDFGQNKQIFKYSAPVRNAKYVQAAMEQHGINHPCDLNPDVLDHAVSLITGREISAEQNRGKIGWFIDVLIEHEMQNDPYEWTPLKQTVSTEKNKSRIRDETSHKSMTADELDAVTEFFNKAATPQQKLVSSVLTLLCCAPMRIQELLEIPRDADIYLNPGDGYQCGLRWFPKKGGMAQIKYIPESMKPVAKKALKCIKAVTKEAHQIALQYENMDVAPCKAVAKQFLFFPYINKEETTRISEALFIQNCTEKGYMTDKVTGFTKPLHYHQVLRCISHSHDLKFNMFAELGITLKDGSTPDINTHKPRHYLNTIANKSSVPQKDIALWSGRKLATQNEVYDHETPEELITRIKKGLGHDKQTRLPTIVDSNEFDVSKVKEACHTTPAGYCLQSLRQNPCELYGSCLNCRELVCVKGANQKLEHIKKQLEINEQLLVKAKQKIAEGKRINPRWIETYNTTITRLTQLVEILQDDSVEDGSLIRMADVPKLIQYNKLEGSLSYMELVANKNLDAKKLSKMKKIEDA
mgnify:FL=1